MSWQLTQAKKRRAATLEQNQSTDGIILSERGKGRARDKAAKMVRANRQYVSDAKKIERDAPEILDHVKQGKLSIPQAKQVAALPIAQRPAAIEPIHKSRKRNAPSSLSQ